jgi:hypothetical protein
MTEKIIVAIIVLAAVTFALRSFVKTLTGKAGCSCTNSCKNCKDLCKNIKK